MKKEYKKPVLYVETFRLCEHIAVACPGILPGSAGHGDATSCTFTDVSGLSFFTSTTDACMAADEIDDVVDGFYSECYNGVTGSVVPAFGS